MLSENASIVIAYPVIIEYRYWSGNRFRDRSGVF